MKHLLSISILVIFSWTVASFAQVPLTDLEPVSVKDRGGRDSREAEYKGKKKLLVDEAPEGKSLSLGERVYKRGMFFTELKQSLDYDLAGDYSGFVCELGIRKGGRNDPASFDVLGDGKYLYESGPLEPGQKRVITLNVSNVEKLTIVVNKLEGLWTEFVLGDPYLIKIPEVPETTAGEAGNKAPKAIISNDVKKGRVPLKVQFNGEKSNDPDGAVYRYSWYFGDGETESLAASPTHTYEQPGVYEVVLQAVDSKGGIGEAVL
jgi:hypothetical protein